MIGGVAVPGDTEGEGEARLLKRGHARTVLLAGSPGAECVVKRFHHPSPWQSWRDPLRALAEARSLRRLRACGLPVPRLLAKPRLFPKPEVRMEAIRDAVSLEDLLLGTTRRSPEWETLLPRLAHLLADLETAPVRHTDLHPGNVLVDPGGGPWLIDFHAARPRRRPPSRDELRRKLVVAAAFSREAIPPRLRRRFYRDWRRALPAPLEAPDVVPAELEQLARRERREWVRHGAGRHLRESARCRVERDGGWTRFIALWPPALPTRAPEIVIEETARVARDRWHCAARLVEHGIPVAVPRELSIRDGRAQARYALALTPTVRCAALPDGEAEVLGRILGLLHDRGLDPGDLGPENLTSEVSGPGPLLLPPASLGDADPLDGWDRFHGAAPWRNDPAFVAAYLSVFDPSPRERDRVAALIR